MLESLAAPGATARLRRAVTTILFILISVMTVRDILVRRWGAAAAAPTSDVTQTSPRGLRGPGKSP